MFRMLEIPLCHHPVATARRVAAELEVFLEQLLGGAPDADIRPVAVEDMVAIERNAAARMVADAASATAATSAAATRTMATAPHTFHVHANCRYTFLFAGNAGKGWDAPLRARTPRGPAPST